MKPTIIKTDDGYMVELPDGNYLEDSNGNNLFDSLVDVFSVTEKQNLSWKIELKTTEA